MVAEVSCPLEALVTLRALEPGVVSTMLEKVHLNLEGPLKRKYKMMITLSKWLSEPLTP